MNLRKLPGVGSNPLQQVEDDIEEVVTEPGRLILVPLRRATEIVLGQLGDLRPSHLAAIRPARTRSTTSIPDPKESSAASAAARRSSRTCRCQSGMGARLA